MSDDGYCDEIMVHLDDIDEALRPALDMRVGLDSEAVDSYAAALGQMPPVLLIHDSDNRLHWVVDGRHRISAVRQAGKKQVKARVKSGTYEEAYHEASRANEVNGIRVTNADKRHRIERALQNAEWATWSSRRLAKLCGVDNKTVEALRSGLGEEVPHEDGEQVPTRTDARGREQPAKKPKPKRPYRNDETPLLDDRVSNTPDTPYEPPPPFVSPVLDQSEVDWESCWADIEDSIMEHYNAWPVEQRHRFLAELNSLVSRLVTEREREEDSDAKQTIPTDA